MIVVRKDPNPPNVQYFEFRVRIRRVFRLEQTTATTTTAKAPMELVLETMQ
jgi:hypothetical protein